MEVISETLYIFNLISKLRSTRGVILISSKINFLVTCSFPNYILYSSSLGCSIKGLSRVVERNTLYFHVMIHGFILIERQNIFQKRVEQ